MRDYQRQKGNKYILPRTLYHQTLWQIRDYYRLKEMAESIMEESPPPPDGQPRGSGVSDQVANKASRREHALNIIGIIDKEKELIPEEYRKGVWDNVLYGTSYPRTADRSTYGRYKSRFVYNIAKNLYLL